jgi:phosphonate degradation associated HDIG domain protein
MSGPEHLASEVAAFFELFDRRGHEHYGEDVTQTQHALQCASLAERDGADEELVVAALLHDVGHLAVEPHGSTWRDDVDDDRHEAIGARLLASAFGPKVSAPVALHVVAKRWRCSVDPDYRDALSAASAASLLAQGGPLDAEACRRFEGHRRFVDAVALRAWDDAAKDPRVPTGELGAFGPLLARVAERRTTSV